MSEPSPHPVPSSRHGAVPVPLRSGTVPVAPTAAPPAPELPSADAAFALALDRQAGLRVPVVGTLAAVFGIAALFKAPIVLAPLGIVFALAALLRRQAGLAAIGAICAVVALAISPVFWGLVGLAWLGSWLLG